MKAIVLVARGLQAGILGCYGNPWADTPALDGLAAESVVFDRHFADAADPAGARRAWRTGRYHLPADGPDQADPSSTDLLSVLREKGVHTCLVADDSRPLPPDFAAGWGEVLHAAAEGGADELDAVLDAAGAALERLEKRDDWLLWLDLATPLPPWDVPAEFVEPYFDEEPVDDEEGEQEEEDEEVVEESEPLAPLSEPPFGLIDAADDRLYLSLQSSYAAAVTYLDAGIGQLRQALANLEGGDDVLFLVTTDVGQNLGEHGLVGTTRPWLHDELIHLPLLVRLPGAAEKGRRFAALTQAVDLAPTLAAWFGAALPDAHGQSLLPLARGEAEELRPYACAGLRVGEGLEYALRTPDWALVLPVKPAAEDAGRATQLYVKTDDRWEVNNVVQHHLELAEQLERVLRDFVTVSRRPGPLHAPPLPDPSEPEA